MTFGIVIRILVLCCLVGPNITLSAQSDTTLQCGGFTVRGGEVQPTSFPKQLQFKDVLTDFGGWSTATNDFEALCTGAYFFTFSVLLSPVNGNFKLALLKNGQIQVTAYGDENGYQTGSNSALLSLAVGDRIHLKLEQGAIYENLQDEFYNDFTGYLVKEF